MERDKFIEENGRLYKKYDDYRRRCGFSEKTIKKSQQAINHLKNYIGNKALTSIRKENFNDFRTYLNNLEYRGKKISSNTKINTISQLKLFFEFIGLKPEFKEIIDPEFMATWNLSPSERQVMKNVGKKIKKYPKIEEIEGIISTHPTTKAVDRRNLNLTGYCFLTGARISAAVSMKTGLVDLEKRIVTQDPNQGVNTKNKKLIITTIPTLNEKYFQMLVKWIQELHDAGFVDDDPLFPLAAIEKNGDMLEFDISSGYIKESISEITGESIIKNLFINAGFCDYHAHSLRDSHIYYVSEMARNANDIKAISLNVGHENIGTTFRNYSDLSNVEVHNRILGLGKIGLMNIPEELEKKFKSILEILDPELYSKYYGINKQSKNRRRR